MYTLRRIRKALLRVVHARERLGVRDTIRIQIVRRTSAPWQRTDNSSSALHIPDPDCPASSRRRCFDLRRWTGICEDKGGVLCDAQNTLLSALKQLRTTFDNEQNGIY